MSFLSPLPLQCPVRYLQLIWIRTFLPYISRWTCLKNPIIRASKPFRNIWEVFQSFGLFITEFKKKTKQEKVSKLCQKMNWISYFLSSHRSLINVCLFCFRQNRFFIVTMSDRIAGYFVGLLPLVHLITDHLHHLWLWFVLAKQLSSADVSLGGWTKLNYTWFIFVSLFCVTPQALILVWQHTKAFI